MYIYSQIYIYTYIIHLRYIYIYRLYRYGLSEINSFLISPDKHCGEELCVQATVTLCVSAHLLRMCIWKCVHMC